MSTSANLPATRSRAKRKDLVSLEAKPRKRSVGRPPKTPNATIVSSEETSVEKTPKRTYKKRVSPARKSPTRQSPARQAKIKATMLRSEPIVRLPIINLLDSESGSETEKESTSEPLSRRAIKNIASNIRSRAKQQTSRDTPDAQITNAVLFRPYKPSKRAIEFSDDDELETLHLPTTKAHSVDHANTIITLLYLLIELSITLTLPLICNNKTCEFRLPNNEDLKTLKESLSLTVFLSIAAFVIFNGIVSILPIGGKRYSCRTVNCHEYILNGLFALVVQLLALITCEMYHIPVTLFVINNYLKFVTASVLFAFLLGVLLFLKSLYAREITLTPEYTQNSHVANFILGGHIHPRFASIDVKFVLIRCCIIGSILIVLSFLYQSMEMISVLPSTEISLTSKMLQNLRIRPTLFVMAALTLIYFVEFFIFESGLLTTLELCHVSWGFMKTLEYVTGTFIYCMMIKYVYDFNVELSNIELGVSTAIFLFGYTIYRASNSQKHSFNENPYGRLGAAYESIPTTMGRKLLCSGYWGIVRRPNYLGDIILTLSFARFVWPSPTLLVIVFIVANLVQRAIVDNKRCRKKYGLPWDRYCLRVPYLLIPKIF